MHSKHALSLALASLLLTGGFACSDVDDGNLREDVIHCEMALSHVLECCPTMPTPPMACVYHHEEYTDSCGCSGNYTHSEDRTPVLGVVRSEKLGSSSCEELTANDGCSELAREFGRDTFIEFTTPCSESTAL